MTSTHRGRLITFEGSEGCGKSTQISLLSSALRGAGKDLRIVREPGGTYIGERLRELLKFDEQASGMCAQAELLLFAASRAQLVREVINPALEAGTWILCDRFLDSTTVYQGVARRLAPEAVAAVNAIAVGNTLPDLTFILDLPVQIGMERARARALGGAGRVDRMEQEAMAFYQSVREGYLRLAAEETANSAPRPTGWAPGTNPAGEGKRLVVIDAQSTPEAIHAEIIAEVRRRFDIS